MNTKHIRLTCTTVASKEYRIYLDKLENDLYVVNYAYGPIGGNLKTGTKTEVGVDLETAKRIYDKLVAEKVKKGYVPDADVR